MCRFRKTKLIFFLLIAGLLLYFSSTPPGCGKVFAQEVPDSSEDNLQFSVDGGKIYFFQPETGRIFVYHSTSNRLNRILTLEELGKDLKQSRSLSVIKEKE